MNKGGGGIGSASIVLIFAVLCMTVFTLISLKTALADKALADMQEQLVKDYYEADTRAEYILAEILKSETVPEAVNGVAVTTGGAEDGIIAFSCPMSDNKEISVEIAVYENSYDILKWKIQDTGQWVIDESLPVWPG